VPDVKEICESILREVLDSAYSIHLGCTKMYQDLKTFFWWHGMKRDVAEYVALCDTCQRVKAEHQRLARLLQPLKIPEWKWGLPRTQSGYDSIWVIVDGLTKVAHFVPVKTTYTGAKLAELYMARIVCLHGVPKIIVSDRGPQFTSKFWEKFHESLDTGLNFRWSLTSICTDRYNTDDSMKSHGSIWVVSMWCSICTNPILRCFNKPDRMSCRNLLFDMVLELMSWLTA
jgi:uncharacterized protein involved in tolerance to divalent cations